jgi:hypothetical protein
VPARSSTQRLRKFSPPDEDFGVHVAAVQEGCGVHVGARFTIYFSLNHGPELFFFHGVVEL